MFFADGELKFTSSHYCSKIKSNKSLDVDKIKGKQKKQKKQSFPQLESKLSFQLYIAQFIHTLQCWNAI